MCFTPERFPSHTGEEVKSLQLIGVMVLLVGVAGMAGGIRGAWPSVAILVGSLTYVFGRIAVWMAKE